eukprot:8858124-Pyramimonas_sp.AAC.1
MIKMFAGRGIGALPADHWISQQDLPHANAWHPQKMAHNLEPECLFAFAANAAVPTPPPADPARVNDYQGHAQAQDTREAFRIRL